MTGRLIGVVGPSGVGKDSVMAGIAEADHRYRVVKRTITRAPDLGGEDYDAMDTETFLAAAEAGAFALHWTAHGLSYGIPASVCEDIRTGAQCLANLSRGVLLEAARVFPALTVLHITASPDVLAARLASRGRETSTEIAGRLRQARKPVPDGLDVIAVSNDGPLTETVAAALSKLQPVRV